MKKLIWLAATIPLLLAGCGGHAMSRATPGQALTHRVSYEAALIHACADTAGRFDDEIAARAGLPNDPRAIIIWKEMCAHILADARIY